MTKNTNLNTDITTLLASLDPQQLAQLRAKIGSIPAGEEKRLQNSCYVPGSARQATQADVSAYEGGHGDFAVGHKCGDICCAACGEIFVQAGAELHQSRKCPSCSGKVSLKKALAAMSTEEIMALLEAKKAA